MKEEEDALIQQICRKEFRRVRKALKVLENVNEVRSLEEKAR